MQWAALEINRKSQAGSGLAGVVLVAAAGTLDATPRGASIHVQKPESGQNREFTNNMHKQHRAANESYDCV